MAYTTWTQDNFTKGELTPFFYARAKNASYYLGLKQAQNVLMYPTGAAGKRFGTLFQNILNATDPTALFFQTFQYIDQCIYQLVFYPNNIDIYLEGIFVANVSTTLTGYNVANLYTTVITNSTGAVFRITGRGFQPMDLVRTPNVGTFTITGNTATTFTVSPGTLTQGEVLPLKFTTTGTLPTTTPQIIAGVTYFSFQNSASTCSIYLDPSDAKFQTNPIQITNTGTGTNKIVFQNTWTLSNTVFKNLPFYDFTGGYDAITFTPSPGTTGLVTITASSPIFTSLPAGASYVGGAFFGNGGAGRIITVTDSTHIVVAVSIPFVSTAPIQGSLALLAEPAWSTVRGYPLKCSSYQSRAIFANTDLLPNGIWTSVINDYTDFGDLTTDDDDAISFYPAFNNINVINFIVPFRSLTVHTNAGVYSNPLSDLYAITPNTFTLQLQDTTPAQVLEPQAIDNQILIVSGNDLHTMVWDGINNAYTSNIVSVDNEQTIRNPVDQVSYANLNRSGSRYCFIINANGSMAIYQTLQSEDIRGLTPQITEQYYGNGSFIQSASSANGRAWFVTQRQVATAVAGINITAFTSSTLTAVATNFSTTIPIAITFTTSGSLPAANPTLVTTQYYWALGVTADTFNVYLTLEDALAGTNQFTFTSDGASSQVVSWPLVNKLILEELTEDVKLDCAFYFNNNGSPASTITTGTVYNAQNVSMVGDGFGFTGQGFNNQVTFVAHGITTPVNEGYIGYPINLIIEPMPISMPPDQTTTLTKPTHLRSVRWWFNNTIGGTINGVPIAIKPFNQANIGNPPVPANGVFEMMIMSGWDDINYPSFTIEHSDPFDIQLLGISYSIEF